MSLTIILGIIIVHYVADFIFQTDEMAINKSKSNKHLFQHVFIYSLTWVFCLNLVNIYNHYPNLVIPEFSFKFGIITFICHFITDYVTSRASSYFYKKKNKDTISF